MQWGDTVKLTETDAKIWGGHHKAGDEVTYGLMVRYPTLARKTDQELNAFTAASAKRDAAMRAQLEVLTKAVGALAAGSAADVTQAFKVGLAELDAEIAKLHVQPPVITLEQSVTADEL
jgi:hypothetical protein